MIHYHGCPISPRSKLLELVGRCFCVSYADPRDVEVVHEIGQSVLLDNGAFSFWRSGKPVDWDKFAEWAQPWLEYHTTWAIVPDVIEGDEEENDRLITWLYAQYPDVWRRSAPVWHLHESIDRLKRLCHGYERVCIGSSGAYATVGNDAWHRRMETAFNAICPTGPPPVWVHMLRGMSLADGHYPFASLDSTDLARNHNRGRDIRQMADRWDAQQCPARWEPRHQLQLAQGPV